MNSRRNRPRAPPELPATEHTYRMALDGELPAEALPTGFRWHLVATLHERGWTDVEIAEWTQMSTYTASRIRSEMKLAPNHSRSSDGAR
jgi:hypothetical protein